MELAAKALLTSRARMAKHLSIGGPKRLPPAGSSDAKDEQLEVTYTFTNKQGATVVMADVVTVQEGGVITSIVRYKKAPS